MALNFKSEHFPNLMKLEETIYNYHDSMELMRSYVDSIVRYGERNDSPLVTREVIEKEHINVIDVKTSSEGGTKIHINRNMLWPKHEA